MKILTFDLEIEKPVSSAPGGWEAARNGECGISVICVSDSETGYYFYDKNDLDEAVDHLNSGDLLVSWNGIAFDAQVIFGCTGRYLMSAHYDLLAETYKSLKERRKGYKLDQVARATLGIGKRGNGEFATALVAKKRWGRLFTYCAGDVHCTRALYNHVVDLGWLKGGDNFEVFLEKPPVMEFA
jgi:hypothetical protein